LLEITVGTFNLNNLFSRYNFKGEIEAIENKDTSINGTITYEFGEDSFYKIRTYMGSLVGKKEKDETNAIAERINRIKVDVLAIQEAENIDTLRQFNRERLDSFYKYCVLIEGNDPRLIDIGILSTYPIGAITSWQRAVHPEKPNQTVFGRDLLEVEILSEDRSKRLFTLFNNHLKSHYVDYKVEDKETAKAENNKRRKRQAEMIADIVKTRMPLDGRFIILGDMNDAPDSPHLKPFVENRVLNLTNALADPKETRAAKEDDPSPTSKAWTHRYKPPRKPAEYKLFDQIWVSAALSDKYTEACIDRRTKHGGDGSDHDPAWIKLNL
jgi:endonuclease/exonuclease/phosphatase family metal-dependent hydrolase